MNDAKYLENKLRDGEDSFQEASGHSAVPRRTQQLFAHESTNEVLEDISEDI